MVISDIDQLEPAWLTEVLKRNNLLDTGEVTAVKWDLMHGTWSKMYRIRPTYDAPNAESLPQTFLLKICAGENGVFGPSEVHYYTNDYTDLANRPIPICYDGSYQANPRAYHLLVEDLSKTHSDTWEMTVTLERGKAVTEALARLHAHYWGPVRIESIGEHIPGPEEIERYVNHNLKGLEPILEMLADTLDPLWRQVLLDVFEYHPKAIVARTQNPTAFTIIHGDVNPGNTLAPIEGEGRIYLIDRQPFDWSLTCWLGVADLAYMMVEWWDIEFRRKHEKTILRHYQTILEQQGIDYPWEMLWDDYRLTAVQSLQGTVEWCVLEEDREGMRWVWEPKLQRAMAAYFDLNCEEVIRHS